MKTNPKKRVNIVIIGAEAFDVLSSLTLAGGVEVDCIPVAVEVVGPVGVVELGVSDVVGASPSRITITISVTVFPDKSVATSLTLYTPGFGI